MDQVVDVLLRMIVRGSDDLVVAVYRRLQADQWAKDGVAPGLPAPMTWRQLAAMAVAERVVVPDQAGWLLAMEGEPPGEPMQVVCASSGETWVAAPSATRTRGPGMAHAAGEGAAGRTAAGA
jgi:hypothetical protein